MTPWLMVRAGGPLPAARDALHDPGPGPREVRLRPDAPAEVVRGKAAQVRALLAKGHVVRLRHVTRGPLPAGLAALLPEVTPGTAGLPGHLAAERLLAGIAASYEAIARLLQPVAWRSRGPFLARRSVDVFLLPGRG